MIGVDPGVFQTTELRPGEEFVEELIALTREYGQTQGVAPQVAAVLEDPTEEKWFRFIAQKWAIERGVEGTYVSRLLAIPEWGERYELPRSLLVEQLWEERQHTVLWEKTLLKKGFITQRSELWRHPYFRLIPEYQGFLGWLHTLHAYPIAVMWAGENLASERIALQTMEVLAKRTTDKVLQACFAQIAGEEAGHDDMGRRLVASFADTVELQNLCRWAAIQSAMISCRAHQAFVRFIRGEESRPYDV